MIHVISLGAGVQSSTMALMASHGEITPMPDAAIFADTQAEPQSVYRWLDWLVTKLPFPVYRVTAGNLQEDFLNALRDPKGRCAQPPFFTVAPNTGKIGLLKRKCTSEYKLVQIRRKVRELCNGNPVIQWIGISLDEAHRMKPSGVKYIENQYPLIDRMMTRYECLNWMKRNGYPKPPKSACIFCPYISDNRLRGIIDNEPDEWKRIVAFDYAMRNEQKHTINGAKITGTLYVHRSCKPIDQVDLSTPTDHGQIDMFGDECEGMCGL